MFSSYVVRCSDMSTDPIGTFMFEREYPKLTYQFKWPTAYACPVTDKDKVCCKYGAQNGHIHTLCQSSQVKCPAVLGTSKLIDHWNVTSCRVCWL